MEWLTDPFMLGFQQRALLGGMMAGVMCAVVGTWIVLRGMTFFGDAFVHGVVPGVAAAVLLDINPLIGAAVAALVMVGGVELVSRQTQLHEDTGIGLLFVGMLGLGVVIVSKTASFQGSVTSILFGDILGLTVSDVVVQSILTVIVVTGVLVLYRPLLALSFDKNKAQLLGMKPSRTHAALLVLIAITVVGSYRSVGTLLVFGMLVAPPATASLLARTVPSMMLIAVGVEIFSVWAGLILSYHMGTAASATMAIVPVGLFFCTLLALRLKARRAVSSPALTPRTVS